ncbi:ABC transporter permease [Catellatospora sp. IY07-71]|uniref:ABC transporter permease n=1 Tax=Catellatospora sp. IY07-71 TaxID=2728827 RepID=UPI001BB37CCF|nr:ABC-2 family transporter protein [Catellatospora sp. IY07-71]BCJ72609.1 ABC transporter permease [Catellatospora sp. IY07-71]
MRRVLRIYRRSLGAHLRAVLEYEADFWILVVAGLLFQVLNLVFLSAVFAHVPALNGWSYPEAVLLAGTFGFINGLGPLFFEGTWRLARRINHGELDYPLVRPVNVPVQVISGGIGMHGFGDVVGGGAMIGWGLANAGIEWTPVKVVGGLLMLVSSATILLSLIVIGNAVSFWVGGPHPVFAMTLIRTADMAKYPITIYGVAVRAAFTVLVPYAFISFFPATWVLDKEHSWIGLLTPLMAAYCVWLARTVFRAGLRRYDSAGH